jgi:oligopeptide/dipeptide ABC transporter ATP-binding protein
LGGLHQAQNSIMKPILKLHQLSKLFRRGGIGRAAEVRALHRVDLELAAGDTLGLVGESGCGKSTLARCALRLLEPTSGSVYFDGEDLSQLSPPELRRRRREFQIIFQDSAGALDPRMTIGQILEEPYEVHGLGTHRERQSWISQLMQSVALDESFARSLPGSLSGGQQQRVAIARALALKPRLLIADEPVSALDASVQAQILNLLADVQRRFDLALILVSHSLPVVRYLCERVAVMYLGSIVEESRAEDFFREPNHPYSRALLASMPRLDLTQPGGKPSLPGEPPSPVDPPPGCAFHPRCAEAMDRCRAEAPRLEMTEEKNKVACFLYT